MSIELEQLAERIAEKAATAAELSAQIVQTMNEQEKARAERHAELMRSLDKLIAAFKWPAP